MLGLTYATGWRSDEAPADARLTAVVRGLCDNRRLETNDGTPVPLTAAEFELLCVLLAGRGRVLSREQLLTRSRRNEADVFDRTIDVLILRLRRKIERSPEHPRFIRTERGYGYVFDGAVEVIGQP